MKNLFLITITALTMLFCITSCEVENDLQELEQNSAKSGFATINPVNPTAKSTTLNTFWMRDDHEPWNRGNAEIYAHIIGFDGNRKPIFSTVRMPYANNDKTMYYPNQKLIDWTENNYAGGLVSIVFMEADDKTTVPPSLPTRLFPLDEAKYLNRPIAQALNILTSDFLSGVGLLGFGTPDTGVIYDSADDLVDVFYNISRDRDYEVIDGAVGGDRDNVYVTLKRKFD